MMTVRMTASSFPAEELKSWGPTLQCALRKTIIYFSLVSVHTLWTNSLTTDPISSLQNLQSTVNTCAAPTRGRIGGSPHFHHLLGPYSESSHPTMPGFVVYDNPICWLQMASLLQCLRSLPHSGTPGVPVTP